ncbi:MAG: thioesterase family protein, partial [Microthrixaceae bacterium]
MTEDQIDHLGHMNVMFYAQHAQAGAQTLAAEIGLDTPGSPGTLFQPDRYTRHHREQLLGANL